MKTDLLDLRNMDCMELMAQYEDNHFDLAIVDPPYGIDVTNQSQGKGGGVARKVEYKNNDFDKSIPQKPYFDELKRVSKNQVVWGGNYMIEHLSNTPCFIVWDKENGETDFADCELAWTSFKTSTRMYRFKWSGMLQGDMKNKEKRIHPTQKPVKLYSWLLNKYAKEGYKILDTHLGSGSHAIACHYAKCHLTASELDEDYYKAACERIERETAQLEMF
jgi:site-specific DNA-methyltransferase (adenine-specific)